MSEQTTRESRSSVELHRHKDGTYYWDIKRYQQEGETTNDVLLDIEDADQQLRDAFPPEKKP